MQDGDSPTQDLPVYDQLLEAISTLSAGQQTELLGIIDDRWGEKSRQDDRKGFFMTVDYVVNGRYYRDFIQDMSDGGVFIKTRQKFEPGQEILMTFMAPNLQKPFKISGEIMRRLDNGIGVRFKKESQVQVETISALVDQINPGGDAD
jgi:Tfp pilus assembly protein PilZ